MTRYAFFRDFKGSDSVLFTGDAVDLARLSRLLQQIAHGEIGGTIPLDEKVGFHAHHGSIVQIETGKEFQSECRLLSASGPTIQLWWRLSRSAAEDSAERVDALSRTNTGRHAYLETSGEIQIIASFGEYDWKLLDN